jgi:hypothetical protein
MPTESSDIIIFRIFIIFIKNQKKHLIIKELEKQKDNLGLKGSMKQFYTKFEPYVLPLGEFYQLIMNSKIKIIHINKINNRTKKITNRTKKISKKSQTTKSNKFNRSSKGGFLFMLTDKGKEPITGDDIKKMMDKYNKAFGFLYYTRYGQDGTVVKGEDGEIQADLVQPYTALQAILAASSKDLGGIAMNRGMDILSLLQNPSQLAFDGQSYYSLYKLYMREYYKSEALHDPKLQKKIALETRLAKGPPPDPTYLTNFLSMIGSDTKSVYADVNLEPDEMSYGQRSRLKSRENRERNAQDWKDWRQGKGKYENQ